MRDATGKAADCLHLQRLMQLLLALPQGFLGVHALSDVSRVDDDALHRGMVQHVVPRSLQRHPATIMDARTRCYWTQRICLVSNVSKGARHDLMILLVHELEQRTAD